MQTIPESHRDLLDAPVAVLATQGPDSYPQVTATWFLYDPADDSLRLSLNTTRQKVKNLSGHPACTLFILDPANPYRTLELRARADVQPDADFAFAARLGQKYNADVRAHDQPTDQRVVVTLHPVKVNVWG